jgi:hypothetical protein
MRPPAPREGGSLTDRLARAQLDPDVSTVRTPAWRDGRLCRCGHAVYAHTDDRGCTGRQHMAPGVTESCICGRDRQQAGA